jgi:hypothetical protein
MKQSLYQSLYILTIYYASINSTITNCMNSKTPPSIKKHYKESKKRIADQQKTAFLENSNGSVKRRLVFNTDYTHSVENCAALIATCAIDTINK